MSRIKLVLGGIEIEYEGEQAFIETELLNFAEKVIALGGSVPVAMMVTAPPSLSAVL